MYNSERQKISVSMITECYRVACEIHQKKINLHIAIEQVIDKTEMNPKSAKIYIQTAINMINGQVYEKGIQILAVQKYIQFIKKDFGAIGVNRAIDSVKKYIQHAKQYDVSSVGLKEIIEWLEFEQEKRKEKVINPIISKTKTLNLVVNSKKNEQHKDAAKPVVIDKNIAIDYDDKVRIDVNGWQTIRVIINDKEAGKVVSNFKYIKKQDALGIKIYGKKNNDKFEINKDIYKIIQITKK